MLGKAKEPTTDHVDLAHKIYAISKDYDFGESQMDCDRELIKLGLAREGVDPEYPEDGETMLYGPVKSKKR